MAQKQSVKETQEKQLSILAGIFNQLKLVWLLFKDHRVSVWTKLVVPLSLIYLVSPIDFVPDVLLGLGQLDDLGVILLGMTLFVKLCPPNLVDYYARQLEYGTDFFKDDSEAVDATYRVIDEE